ncbi:MAG: hypothetical protein COC17_00225 [Hyphomicrobiales bacterium]|nr:trimeric intracellular cation channel family protein [Hyphomicrobiales bacterium]PCH51557.1 MAG: hypothetical protein COC17_00225 [Hyphomicrobiales bacterium]
MDSDFFSNIYSYVFSLTLPADFSTAFFAIDTIAAITFAITGALVASRKELDILGFMWFAIITGVGGGTVRDLILDQPVFWIVDQTPIYACLVTAILVYFIAPRIESRYKYILWADALGMAFVTIAGTAKSLEFGTGSVVAIIMGVTTASVGGIIRDTLGQEPSVILRREIYVAASAAGAITMTSLVAGGVPAIRAAAIGFCVAFLLRILAVIFNWTIPVYRSRPGSKK